MHFLVAWVFLLKKSCYFRSITLCFLTLAYWHLITIVSLSLYITHGNGLIYFMFVCLFCFIFGGEGLDKENIYKYHQRESKRNVKLFEQSKHWSSTGVQLHCWLLKLWIGQATGQQALWLMLCKCSLQILRYSSCR